MAEPEKEFEIFVNSKPRKVRGPTISFEDPQAEGAGPHRNSC
jgi:hypothetical protein